MAATECTQAVLLRSVNYRDADKIVTLYTQNEGKISAIARGARRSRKRFGAALEAGALIEVEIVVGRGQLATLKQAHVLEAFPGILANYSRLAVLGAGLEAVRTCVPERESDERLLQHVVRFLRLLNHTMHATQLLVAFQVRLLALAGWAFQLGHCARCGLRAPGGKAAYFDVREGAVICRRCGGADIKLSGKLRGWLDDAMTDFERAAEVGLSDVECQLSRTILADFVKHHLGRHLVASDVVGQVQEMRGRVTTNGDGSR